MPYTYHDLPDQFARDYIEAALWSTNDESDESGGVPLDQNYSIEDIDDETVEDMLIDCKEFQEANADDLDLVSEVSDGGHDFWLTRNGHGEGFWGRGYRQPQEIKDALDRLSKAAKKWGDYNLWVGSPADLSEHARPDGDNDETEGDGSDEDAEKKIYANRTRTSSARYEKRARKHAMNRRATSPHARCATSKKCLEHAADKSVPSCKRKARHRREK